VKFFALFALGLLVAVSLTACRAGGGSTEATTPQLEMSSAEIAALPEIKIAARKGSAPDKLVIHDLRQGSGAMMKPGDTMNIDWAEAPYGQALESSPGKRRLTFTFGKYIKGWEEGVPGMRVGGRRELIVPTSLGDTGHPMVYIIDLLGIEPSEGSTAQRKAPRHQ
jgi:peptidylprolyl isomerase